jgi:hypothetical protein
VVAWSFSCPIRWPVKCFLQALLLSAIGTGPSRLSPIADQFTPIG